MIETPLPIYLDGFATMPLAPEARDAMFASWGGPSNAGSPHILGERAAAAVANARSAVATLLGATPAEIVFTSGATEANNLALLGIAQHATGNRGRHRIIVSAIEHKAVLEPAHSLERLGFDVIVAPVDGRGVVDPTALGRLIDDDTLLVSVMLANNETGAVQPVSDIVPICRAHGALLHCDGAQAAGKLAIDAGSLGIDYLSVSSHKMYGPVGVGALYVSSDAPRPLPMQFGGGQQGGIRPGTEPVPLIVGFGAAAAVALRRLGEDAEHGRRLADRLLAGLDEHQVGYSRATSDAEVLPGSSSLAIMNIEAEDLVSVLQAEVCLSTGSACTSGQIIQSHVLAAMGIGQDQARSILRIYCNRYTTDAEIDEAAARIADACRRIGHRTGRSRQ